MIRDIENALKSFDKFDIYKAWSFNKELYLLSTMQISRYFWEDLKAYTLLEELPRTFALPSEEDIKKLQKKNKPFPKEKGFEFFLHAVPKKFWDQDTKLREYFVFHWEGKFFKFTRELDDKITLEEIKESDVNSPIFDPNNYFDYYIAEMGSAVKEIKDRYKDFVSQVEYNPSRYKKEVVVEKDVSDKYDPEYSLTKDQVDKMLKWQREHARKYHNGCAAGGGTSPVSYFEIKYGVCSIGSWIDCECSACKENNKDMNIYKYSVKSNF